MAGNTNIPENAVVDSSFVVARLLPDEKFTRTVKDYFNDFVDGTLLFVAPLLLKYEVANALRSAILQKRLDISTAEGFLEEFLSWPIVYLEINFNDTLKLAVKESISVYDATYLYLARSNNWQLLSLDRKLSSIKI